jgi:kinesin family protein 18/19
MIANVSPSHLSYDDSYNTLRYADRAKRIKCQVICLNIVVCNPPDMKLTSIISYSMMLNAVLQIKKNTMSVSACLTQYTKVVEEMSHKIEQLQSEIVDMQRDCTCKVSKTDIGTDPGPEVSSS